MLESCLNLVNEQFKERFEQVFNQQNEEEENIDKVCKDNPELQDAVKKIQQDTNGFEERTDGFCRCRR